MEESYSVTFNENNVPVRKYALISILSFEESTRHDIVDHCKRRGVAMENIQINKEVFIPVSVFSSFLQEKEDLELVKQLREKNLIEEVRTML